MDAPMRLYSELADWWPIFSAPDEYVGEATIAAEIIERNSRIPVATVLELGSGGGNNASHMKARFTMTLTDVSVEMLDVSRGLNPDCEHIAGDMRTLRLGREFDAVFVHDAVMYMRTVDDLRAAAETAFVHCRAGGVALFEPDFTAETFEPSTDCGGEDDPSAGRAIRWLEWSFDPDPTDHELIVDYVIVRRDSEGAIDIVHDRHHEGVFPRQTWLDVLSAAGFEARSELERDLGEYRPREVFIGCKPPA